MQQHNRTCWFWVSKPMCLYPHKNPSYQNPNGFEKIAHFLSETQPTDWSSSKKPGVKRICPQKAAPLGKKKKHKKHGMFLLSPNQAPNTGICKCWYIQGFSTPGSVLLNHNSFEFLEALLHQKLDWWCLCFLSHGGCTIFFFFFTDCPKEKL